MVNFTKLKLGQITEIQTGPFGSQLHNDDYVSNGTPIVTVEHLGNKYFTTQNLPLVSEEDKNRLYKYILKENDIVFSRVGSVDRCSIVSINEDGWLFSGRCLRVRPNAKYINPQWLYYYFTQNYFKQYVRNKAVGCTMPSLNTELLSELNISFPDLSTQKKIADVLSSIDDKIALNNKTNTELENMAKTIYDYWFTQFDFPDKNGHPYKTSGGQMVYNELLKREIPAGWEVKKLSEVISSEKNAIVDGPFGTQLKIEEYVESGIPVYEMWMLNNCFIVDNPNHFITKEKFEDVKRSCVKNGDILISKTGTLGLLGLLETRDYEKGLIVSRLAKITPDCNKIGRCSLLIYLKEINDSGYWLQKSAGSTMPILNNELIGSLPVLWPNTNLYQIMESKISPLFDRIHELQLENKKLIEIRDYLLPLLMNGQITIN